jgi:cholesterol oxidase
VVDAHGRVFGHPGLHIADGSVMPGPVGANPSLTIAAMADRFADRILTEPRGLSVSVPRTPATVEAAAPAPHPPSPSAGAVRLAFTEEMKGFIAFGERDFAAGFHDGQRAGNGFMFHLTITAEDIERFIADPEHLARAEGWIDCDELGGRLEVSRGDFNLFVDEAGPGIRRMLYRLEFADGEEHPLTMTGYKQVGHESALHLWPQTTTLYTRVLGGHVPAGTQDAADVLASGVIHILPLDFARQMTTFRVHPADRVDALAKFGALFAGELWDVYKPGAGAREPAAAR